MSTIYADYRMGGKLTYRLLKEGERPMRVPEEMRECVVFLGIRFLRREEPTIAGTAFFIAEPIEGIDDYRHEYIITADHNLRKIDELFTEKQIDGIIYIRMTLPDGTAVWVPTRRNKWISHSVTDIAIYHNSGTEVVDPAILKGVKYLNHMSISRDLILDEKAFEDKQIGVGDELVVVGLFTKFQGKHKNIPMVRSGILSVVPREPVRMRHYGEVEAYLVELRSVGGFSGSPVFVSLGGPIERGGRKYTRTDYWLPDTYYLLGVLHGHWPTKESEEFFDSPSDDTTDKINTGIAVVVPAKEILTVLNSEEMMKIKADLEKRLSDERAPKEDSEIEGGITKEEFEKTLKKASQPILPYEGEKGK